MSATASHREEGQYDSVSLPRVLRGTDREAATKVPTMPSRTRNGIAYGLLVCSLLYGQWVCVVQQWHHVVNKSKGDHRCTPNKACGH